MHKVMFSAGLLAIVAPACTPPPSTRPSPLDVFHFTEVKDFSAFRVSSNHPDLQSNDDSFRPIAGETIVLADLEGPGMVTHIWLTVAANEYGWPRLLRLRIYYDGSPIPSVDSPVGDFFAVGHGFERQINSVLIRDSSSGRSRNSYWPMPFAKSCRITLTNEGNRRMSNVYYHVDWKALPELAADTPYFHARYRQALPTLPGKMYELVRVSGRGHYVGTVLSVVQHQPGWFGEGDEYFFIDGEPKPRIEGTGTEDYFNDAWTLRVSDGPYAGVSVADGTGLGSRMTAYRWHVVDPIPFTRSLRFEVEHAGWTHNPDGSVRSAFEERADLFSSVAFWYQLGIARDQPELPYGSRRLPHGNALQIEVEQLAGEVKTEGGTASVQKDVFWSKDLLFFKANGPGSKIEIPLDVPDDGAYELTAQLAHSFDYGNYSVLVDGKPPRSVGSLEHEPGANTASTDRMNTYFTEIYVAEDHLIGWMKLNKGRHTVTFVCEGKHPDSTNYFLGIDTLILARIGGLPPESQASRRAAAMRAIGENRSAEPPEQQMLGQGLSDADPEVRRASAWALGQIGPQAASQTALLIRALADTAPVVRGLSALALRNLGSAAGPALDALIAGLKDPEEAVRMMAAQALGRQRAARAIDPLIEACQVKGQHVHVLRALATALGEVGPQAARALPVLREIHRIPRVRWAAQAAIRKIEAVRR